jgi:hypothetical protein
MIITGRRETYDGTWRIVNYATESDGVLQPRFETTFGDAVIPQFFEQQELNFGRLHKQFVDGAISPIGFYAGLTRMNLEDLAARVGLRRSTVRAHLTPEGFARVRVRELEAYARQFDVCVADFFQIAYLREGVVVAEAKHDEARRLQTLVLAPGR